MLNPHTPSFPSPLTLHALHTPNSPSLLRYWSFRTSRTWGRKQKERAAAAAAAGSATSSAESIEDGLEAEDCTAAGASTSGPGRPAVASTNQGKIRSQLAGLRQRAAVRKTKVGSSSGSDEGEATASADERPLQHHYQHHHQHDHQQEAAAHAPLHVAFDDVMAESFSSGSEADEQEEEVEQEQRVWYAEDATADSGAPSVDPPAGAGGDAAAQAPPKPKFRGGNREHVFGQLAGLRRKATITR
jgi:hypothetical protein